MLWEICYYIKKKIVMTVIPAMRNLFSSLKSLAGMLLVMLILQVLLSVICITGIENIQNQQNILNDYTAMIASSNISDEVRNSFLSENFRVAFNSTSIFIGAVIIWGVCAVAAYQKVTFSSADRDKYVWGMLVTHGAKIKKIRSMLKCELYLPHLIATAAAYPLAIALCNYAFRNHGYSYRASPISLLVVLALSYLCIRLVVEYQCLLIRRMSCVTMLKEEDAPKSVCFPKRHSRLVRGFKSSRYGAVTFIRMRKYYLSLAVVAAIPALIWICFQVSAKGEDNYLSSEINEFSVNISMGISEDKLNSIENINLKNIDGVSGVKAGAAYPANKIYTHLLLDSAYFKDTTRTPHRADLYADNTVVLCRYDETFKRHVGYNGGRITDGHVTIVTTTDSEYAYEEGDRIWFAVSKLDGSTRVVGENDLELLKKEVTDCEYVMLTVGSFQKIGHGDMNEKGFHNADGTYFLVSDADYKRITSISPDKYSCEVDAKNVAFGSSLDNKGCFNIRIDRSHLKEIPSAGDCIQMSGYFYATANLVEITSSKTPHSWSSTFEQEFEYLYVNSVTVNGSAIIMNVSPYAIIKIHEGVFWDILLAFGTPALPSSERNYFAMTCGSNLTLENASVVLTGDFATVHTSSAVKAANAGTHALVSSDALTNTDGRLLLERLYADSSFIIACSDDRTASSLGMQIPHVSKGGAVLVLPKNAFHNYKLSVGDKLRIATTKEDVAFYTPDSIITMKDYDMLAGLLDANVYDYVICNVSEIIYDENAEQPYIFVSTEDFCKVINKQAPYVSFDIIINSGVESRDYAKLREAISEWAAGNTLAPKVTAKGSYVDYLLRKNANYSTIMMLISMLVPLIIPFIWYYPLSTLFDRRRAELQLLRAFGKKRGQIRRSFALEGILVSTAAFVSVLLMCYPAMFIFKQVCKWCKLPLTFEYGNLTLTTVILAAAFSALCAAVSFAVCYALAVQRKQTVPK